MDYRTAINAIARECNSHREESFARADIRRAATVALAIIYQTTHAKVDTDLAVAIHTIGDEPCPTTSK